MNERELDTKIEKSLLNDWVDAETNHIDVVASWENLCSTYDALRFTDPLTDEERLGEFKWIVQYMNAFLTKIRTKLLTCQDEMTMIELLQESFTPTGKMELNDRRALAYQKLKQQWIMSTIMKLKMMQENMEEFAKGN